MLGSYERFAWRRKGIVKYALLGPKKPAKIPWSTWTEIHFAAELTVSVRARGTSTISAATRLHQARESRLMQVRESA